MLEFELETMRGKDGRGIFADDDDDDDAVDDDDDDIDDNSPAAKHTGRSKNIAATGREGQGGSGGGEYLGKRVMEMQATS